MIQTLNFPEIVRTRLNPKIIQLTGEALIPLLGFFWWNWSLYFIILFYLLDYFSGEIFMHVKSMKIRQEQKSNSGGIKLSVLSFVFLLVNVSIVHLAMRSVDGSIKFPKEIWNFWSYEDMGVEQGYILIPLIALVGYQRFKMEFMVPMLFKKLNHKQLWNPHLKVHFLILGGSALIIGISSFVIFSDLIYIVSIIAVSTTYQLLETSRN